MRHTLFLLLLCLLVLPLAVAAQGDIQGEIELTRAVIETERQALVDGTLGLTAEQGTVFWPIYREYTNEIKKVKDRLVKVITDYSDHQDNLSDEMATRLLDEHLSIQADQLKVQKKYAKRLRKVLPAKVVTRFFQIENKLDVLIEMELAAEIPLVQ